VNELDTPRMPFSTFAIVLTRPASGTVTSTWAQAFVALIILNMTTNKMPALKRSAFRARAKPNRIAAEAEPRVRRSSRAIAEDFELGPQPS
jgi:hypothetical protein